LQAAIPEPRATTRNQQAVRHERRATDNSSTVLHKPVHLCALGLASHAHAA
jgi:hypothetical protein